MKSIPLLTVLIATCTFLRGQVSDVLVEPQSRTIVGGKVDGPDGGRRTQNVRRELREVVPRQGGYAGAFNLMQAGGAPSRSLVIFSSDAEPKKSAEISEDLAVMSKIVEDSFPEEVLRDPMRKVLGIHIGMQEGQNSRNFYLEDYGVVFFQTVTLPLLPAEKPEAKKEKKSEPEDSTWEEARQELFGRKRAPGSTVKVRGVRQLEYDGGKVEKLKESLIGSLRNATNIRHLKPQESVTIVISSPTGSVPNEEGEEDHLELRVGDGETFLFNSGPIEGERATMVIRAKKSDIDEFARKKQDVNDFKKKVSVNLY
jgi:hypothetical protein